jgi:type III secretory pathway lipoprotein EscJ
MTFLRAAVVFCLSISLLVGCSSAPVADDVAQREANEIVAVLGKHNISASLVKARGGKGRYSVVVAESDFPGAAAVLSRLGLPADKKPSFQELTGGNSIIPPSREVEALRLDRAIASELEDIFSVRRDVASVSVLVRMHSRETPERPTVTVVIQSPEGTMLDMAEVREIARRAVPGIQSEDVYVTAAQSPDTMKGADRSRDKLVPFLGLWRVPESDHGGLVSLVVLLVGLSGILAGLSGYILGQFNWLNRQGTGASNKLARSSSSGKSLTASGERLSHPLESAQITRENGDSV